jgi:hypothetical protein
MLRADPAAFEVVLFYHRAECHEQNAFQAFYGYPTWRQIALRSGV